MLLALCVCVAGSAVTVRLWRLAFDTTGPVRLNWCFLGGLTAGSMVWATHFIAMLGHTLPCFRGFATAPTMLSVTVSIAGAVAGLIVATAGRSLSIKGEDAAGWRSCHYAVGAGGLIIGGSIAAMHYIGMAGYMVDGVVSWNRGVVVLSIALCLAMSTLASAFMVRNRARRALFCATVALSTGVLLLHFVAMMAYHVDSCAPATQPDGQSAHIAMAVAFCALLMLGTGMSSMMINDGARADLERVLRYQALHDPLTGLPNRRNFQEQLAAQCTTPLRPHEAFSLLLLDLDRFKIVNDVHGHPVGDKLLCRASERIAGLVRSEALFARLGGDEFTILFRPGTPPERADEVAGEIVAAMKAPFLIDGHVADVGASIGIVSAPCDGQTPQSLLHNVDMALYAAKEAGRSCYRHFRQGMMSRADSRRAMEAALTRAIERDELVLHFQPVVDFKLSTYLGAEALVRWRREGHGIVAAADFIPLAEEFGLMRRIGAWVIDRACATAARWPEELTLSINVSSSQIRDPGFVDLVASALSRHGLAPHRLEIEITETTLLKDNHKIVDMLCRIKALGVSITLDDFGVGYASLTRLEQYPIDRIKIDRSLIGQIETQPNSRMLLSAFVALGRVLDIPVTASGVETGAQSEWVLACGCAPLQGYLHGRPVPAEELPTDFQNLSSASADAGVQPAA